MLNPLRDFVAFDLETTGLERETDEIIEIGAVRIRAGQAEDRFSCLIKTAKTLTPLVESLTGITAAMLEDGQEPKPGLEAFLAFLGNLPLVAHNSDFDISFLNQALQKAGLAPVANPVFDSLLLARIAYPTMDSHRLENLVERLGIQQQKAHRALPDAEKAASLWILAQEKLAGYLPKTLATMRQVLAAGPAHWRDLFSPSEQGSLEDAADLTTVLPVATPATAGASERFSKTSEKNVETLFTSPEGMAKAFASLSREYQPRPRQAKMAAHVERGLSEAKILVLEAESGTGKALACLVSAARHALSRHRPVFLSVASRALAEHIVTQEFPLLRALFGEGLRLSVLKHPSAYLSPRKYASVLAHPETRLREEERLAILPLITWMENPGSGDIGENMGFNHDRNRLLWSKLSSDTYASEPGSFGHAAREKAARAQVVLISHDLFLDDLALDFALLPAYESILFDEAHRLPELGQTRLGREVSFFRLKHILQLLAFSKTDASGLLAELERVIGPVPEAAGPATETSVTEITNANSAASAVIETSVPEKQILLQSLKEKVFEPEKQLQKFFNRIAKHAQKRRKDGESKIRFADKMVVEFGSSPEPVTSALTEVEDLLTKLAQGVQAADIGLAQDLRKTGDLLRAFRTDLDHVGHPSGKGEIYWIEDFPNPHRALIRSAPLQLGPTLVEKFYPQTDAAIFISSSIALGDELQFFCNQIGLDESTGDKLRTSLIRGKDAADKGAPVFLAKFSPLLSNAAAAQAMSELLIRSLKRTGRSAFILYTHVGMLKQSRALLQEGLGKEGRLVLAQHMDGSRDNILNLFRTREDACLLGTEAFVDGLPDMFPPPELIVVTKLPFPVPTEPLIAATLERLQETGKNPLYDFLVPSAILKLKLELARMPRRAGRRQAIWILDPRLVTEKYARYFLRSLNRDSAVFESEEPLLAKTLEALQG